MRTRACKAEIRTAVWDKLVQLGVFLPAVEPSEEKQGELGLSTRGAGEPALETEEEEEIE